MIARFQMSKSVMEEAAVTQAVRGQYDRVARSTLSNAVEGVRAVAEAFGYSAEELAGIPAEANMGLSCGNPLALANVRAGEVVLDLGSGGGLDVFLAGQKVGPTGRAIGVDMTPSMIDRARAAAKRDGIGNVEFRLGAIDALPVADSSVDVVISNCVINLAADKGKVFREIARVLKPGGRLAVSDIALKKELPPEVAKSIAAYVGCIAGAIGIEAYVAGLKAAGLRHVEVVDSGADLNAYAKVENQSACCSPAMGAVEEAGACCSPVAVAKPVGEGGACCTAEAKAEAVAAKASCCGGGEKEAGAKRSVSLGLAKTEGACCSSEAAATAAVVGVESKGVHQDLAGLLATFDVNAYAASVKVYAVK